MCEQLDKAQIADPLYNALQLDIVHYGEVHGGGGPERLVMQQQQMVFGTTIVWLAIILGPAKPTDASATSETTSNTTFDAGVAATADYGVKSYLTTLY
ncbi:hypothetical protein Tco_0613397 [Tanacetum coccineum]